MACLCDEHAILAADHAPALAQRKLDNTGVKAVLLGPGNGVCRRQNRAEIHHPSFRLGDDLVFDDQDVPLSQRDALTAKGVQQFFCESVARSDLICKANRDETKFASQTHAHPDSARVRRSAKPHWRARRWVRVSAGRLRSCRRSAALSMSIAMPGSSSTMQGFCVACAAATWGLKLSLPKRRGNRPAGRRKTAFVPRPSPAGTSSEPSCGACAMIYSISTHWIRGNAAGITRVLSPPRASQRRVAISMAPVSPGLAGSGITSKPWLCANSTAKGSLVTTATSGRWVHSASLASTSCSMTCARAVRAG